MKQITYDQARGMAMKDRSRWQREVHDKIQSWLRDNAKYIADIETGLSSKTLFGEWPGGWQKEMRRAAKSKARDTITENFIRTYCARIDGAIWLNKRLLPKK